MSEKKYSQVRAMLAISRASFRSITRSPSAVVFTLAFPMVFILVFGFLRGGGVRFDIGVDSNCDKQNPLYAAFEKTNAIKLIDNKSDSVLKIALGKGTIDGIISIHKNNSQQAPYYSIVFLTSDASVINREAVKNFMSGIVNSITLKQNNMQPVAVIEQRIIPGREYKTIDFILPGQLGFSLLSSGVFGTAFVFFSLRQTLVLKRFFATPIQRPYIVLGEAIARMVFALLGALFIIGIGYFAFGFTLVHGLFTAITMLLLCAIGLILFMGFGFVVSGLAKSESTIPPLANIITLPQFLLSGTFFSVDNFPTWLQPICKALPLTYLNDAMRKVAFEGASINDVWFELLILAVWTVGVYALASKVFKWE